MSRSEKRYFKLNSGLQEGQKNYMLLFDFIGKMKEYDEDRVLKKFKAYEFTRQLHVAKNYLYQQILKSLRAYYADQSAANKVWRYIENAALLKQRRLYEQSFKWLKKAEKLAWEFELYNLLAQIYEEKVYYIIERQSVGMGKALLEQYHLHRQASEALYREGEYLFSTGRMFANFRKLGNTRLIQKDVRQRIEAIFEHELMQDKNKALSFKSKYLFYFCWTIYYRYYLREMEKSFDYAKLQIQVWENRPEMKKEYSKRYKIYLHNYLTMSVSIGKYTGFLPRVQEMRSLPSKSFDEEVETFQNSYFLELQYYLNSAQFSEAIALIKPIKEGLKRFEGKINKSTEISFYHNITTLYFLKGNFLEAQNWCNKVLFGKKLELKEGIQKFLRVLQLVIYYELGSFRVIETMHESIYRALLRKKQLDQLERIMLKGILKLIYAPDRRSTRTIFLEMHEQVEKFAQEKSSREIPGLDEMKIWLESKIEGVSCEAILRREFLKKLESEEEEAS